MFIRLYLATCFTLTAYFSDAQGVWCNAMDVRNPDQDKYGEFLKNVHEHQVHPSVRPRSETYYQVVVHIITRMGSTPISKAQVIHQIDVLNNDFAGRGENIYKLEEEFKPLITDTGIKFCLATTDPDGALTDGIKFTETDTPDIALAAGKMGRIAIHYDELGGQTGWDNTRYINIWVGEYRNFLGSASLPGMAPFDEETGIVIDPRSFGSLGDAATHTFYRGGHTLTHEMGHFFGLLHIFGTGDHNCTDGDEVEDTPNQLEAYFGCPKGTQISCDVSNMYQNFMDLTDDRCLAAFTAGQSARMQATIDAFYPDLGNAGPCHDIIQPFEKWYDELIWANDNSSDQYVVYHPDGFAGIINVDVFSVDGRLLIQDTWEDTQTYLLNLNGYASGVYFVRISDGEHEKVRKVVTYR
ncbi:MAG TPA: M43 family zinc metalloprotease [Saprospiraceae bacterium]|nr:M43 family zinc metalloprotease [Saprospiraceae bacterium]